MNKVAKLYEWRGVDSLHLPIKTNGEKKVVEFPTGREKPVVKAQFRTGDSDIQAGIERTIQFQSGQIKIRGTYPILEETMSDVTVTSDAGKKKIQNYPSVTNIQMAADKLVEKFGITADKLSTPEAVMATALEVGAVFPNLKTEENIL